MRFIAVDLENNQPSGKITQIGAAAFDTDSGHISSFNVYVDAEEPLNLDHMLNNNMTLGQLLGPDFEYKYEASKIPRSEAYSSFWEWVKESQCGKKIIQWGRGDTNEIITQGKEVGVKYPSHLRIVNLKVVYQTFFQPALKLDKGFGLSSACEHMGISFKGRAHDAIVDAVNTGELAMRMFKIIENYGKVKGIING